MSIDLRNRSHKPGKKRKTPAFLKIFGILMALVYAAFGIFILTSSEDQLALPQNFKVVLGIMLIVYSLVRAYRTYQKYYGQPKRFYDDEDDDNRRL